MKKLTLHITGIVFFCIMALAPVTEAFSQKSARETVTGSVKTTDDKPAYCVAVYLKDTPYGACSDMEGNFRFEAPAGDYTMIVHSITAHSQEFPVTIQAGEVNHFPDITVIESSVSLKTVVVTGQFAPQSVLNSVYKVKIIDSEKIEQKGATDIQSLLNTELGIRLDNDIASGETGFEIMGMTGNDVKVLVDGVPMIERGANNNKTSLSQIDINTVDRVEIVEGPMSVVYGTDALAGVINIITKKPFAPSGKNEFSVSAGIHEETAGDEYKPFSGKGLHRETLHIGWTGKSGLYLKGGFTRNTSGGWKGDKTGREKLWPPKDQYMYTGTVGYAHKGFNAWYRLDYTDETVSTPGNPSETIPDEILDVDFNTDRYTHQLQSDWRVNNNLRFNFASSYQDYQRGTRSVFSNTATGEQWLSMAESAQDKSNMQLLFGRLTSTWNISSKISLQPGVEYEWTKGSGERIEGEPSITDVAFFVSAEWKPLEWIDVRPGVRVILNSDYDAPFAIPALLTKFRVNDQVDVRLSYAYGFRAPKLRELYFSFHNANHNIDGNPGLKAEYSNSFTGSFTWRILHSEPVRLTSTITGFYSYFRDRISMAQSIDDHTHNTYYNIEKYKSIGGTLENNLTWNNLYANAAFSLVGRYNQYAGLDAYASHDLPEYRYSPEVSASVGYRFKTGTDVNLFYKFTGKVEKYIYDFSTDEFSIGRMESFNWMDFTVSQKVWEYLTVKAGVKNIFDITTVENTLLGGTVHSGGGSTSTMGCGRSYFLGISFNLNK